MTGFSIAKLQILDAFSIFLKKKIGGGGVKITIDYRPKKSLKNRKMLNIIGALWEEEKYTILADNQWWFWPPYIFFEIIRKIKKSSRICNFSIENPVIFHHFWVQKYTSISIDFSIFGRDFERIFDILPYYTDVFLVQFLLFSPKKQIFKTKSSKKLKVQKWCQNGSNSII